MNSKTGLLALSLILLVSTATSIEFNSSQSLKYYGNGDLLDFEVNEDAETEIRGIANFTSSQIKFYQPLSILSSSAMSVENGIDLTGSSGNTIDSYSTLYLQTSSGSPTDIVLDPTGEVGVTSNMSITGELNMDGSPITNVENPTDAQDAATKDYVDSNDPDGTCSGNNVFLDGNDNCRDLTTNYGNVIHGDLLQDNQIDSTEIDNTSSFEFNGITNTGNLDMDGNIIENIGGTTDASSGAIRLANANQIRWRDSSDSGDIGIDVNSDDNIFIGAGANHNNIVLNKGSGNVRLLGNDLFEVGGTTDASTGAIRLANDVSIQARDSGNSNDIEVIGTDTSDNVQIGGNGNLNNVEIPNANLDMTENENNISLSGQLEFTSRMPPEAAIHLSDNHNWLAKESGGLMGIALDTDDNQDGEFRIAADDEPGGTPTKLLRVQESGVDIPNGDLDVNNQLSVGSTECGVGEYIDGDGTCTNVSTETSGQYVDEDGDTMTGTLNMDGDQVTNVGSERIDIGDGAGDIDMNDGSIYNANTSQFTGLGVADSLNTVQNNINDYGFYVQDNIKAGGDIVGTGGDVAEHVNTEGELEPGTVATISGEMEISASQEKYDTGVAGIISTDPGVRLKQERGGEPLALTGIVPTKVSVENGDIEPGDMLTTSSREGYAMKCNDTDRCEGAVIGKALEGADKNGKIEVLVTLA